MDLQDWKDKLGAAFDLPVSDGNTTDETATQTPNALEQQGKDMIDIVLEKKGRGGKQATIVTGLHIDDETLKELASELKRHCGVGGSARGGEILIQGDARSKVLALLKGKGFKARII
ncbi:translation initiation factor [Sodaliphilus sp.]|uniref:translation initiation factor n=1 Tax=Sodaliphilus sp. TaxID=2815818 RepID=UPI00388E3371